MRKTCIVIVVLLFSLLLTSCSFLTHIAGGYSDTKAAMSKFEEVLESVKAKDKDALKNAFSKNALAEAEDIDSHIDDLFAFFKGDVISYDWEDGSTNVGSFGHFKDGKRQIELVAWFDVVTDEDSYVFFLLMFSKDTFDADNVGLYALRIVKAEDRATGMTYWQDMAIPGVYLPYS